MRNNIPPFLIALFLCCFLSFEATSEPISKAQWPQQRGIFTLYSKKALALLDTKEKLQTLATGFEWVEGPVWVEEGNYLLFSDIPTNTVYRYDHKNGLQTYLSNSGFSNGLRISAKNELLLMQSRSRVVAKMKAPLTAPRADFETLANHYHGKLLNSPNDSALDANGNLYFTDPPYGLPKQMTDPAKALNFQGVYKLTASGELSVIDDQLTFPNGIALSTNNKWLYVAVSDEKQPAWYRYQLDESGQLVGKELFYQPSNVSADVIGAPDGLKVHSSGWIFATAPGGVWVFDQDKHLLAKINMPGFTANLAFDAQEETMYLTADNELRSLNLKVINK